MSDPDCLAMATAPRDGTRILIYNIGEGLEDEIGWFTAEWVTDGQRSYWLACGAPEMHYRIELRNPQTWTHLPCQPPTVDPTERHHRMRKLDYARGLDTAAAERRAEVSRLRAIIRAIEAEVERIEDRAGEIRRELASNG